MMQPISLAATANNVIGGAAMMLVMTAAPLAAVSAGHTINDGANIIQWHLVGMYAPSLFAGRLIKKFGLSTVLFLGMLLIVISSLFAISSTTLIIFYAALLCLGIGWNFMFVGGSALLTQSHRSSEQAHVQGLSEMIRYALTAIATLSAGPFLEHYGWSSLNLIVLPLILIAAAVTFVWVHTEKREQA